MMTPTSHREENLITRLWSNFVVEPLNISTHRAQEFIHIYHKNTSSRTGRDGSSTEHSRSASGFCQASAFWPFTNNALRM